MGEGTICNAPSEISEQVYNCLREATGHPALNRMTGMPYSQASRVGANLLYFGVYSSGLTDHPDSGDALMLDQLEDFALYRSLQALDKFKGVHDFSRVIVQAGLLEEGVTI